MTAPRISLRQALNDRQLLGDELTGDSWKSWRVLLLAAMGEPLTADERALFKQLTQRDHEPHQPVEEFCVDVPLDQTSGAARFFAKMARDIEGDLGGRRFLSRIEGELIRAFAGAATTLQYLNVQVALGDTAEIDLAGYATMASTMLRIGSRLGLQRRAKLVPDLDSFLAQRAAKCSEPSQ